MKMIAGACLRAVSNSLRMRDAPSPANISTKAEAGCEIARELYLGIVIDRARAMPVLMASSQGGMNIEEVAEKTAAKYRQAYEILTGRAL